MILLLLGYKWYKSSFSGSPLTPTLKVNRVILLPPLDFALPFAYKSVIGAANTHWANRVELPQLDCRTRHDESGSWDFAW